MAAPEGFVHQAQIYGSQTEFVAAALPFVRDGVRAGEPVLVAVPQHNLSALDEALGADAAGAELHSAQEWYENPARTRAKFVRWVAEHSNGHRIRLLGEPQWPLGSEAGIREWARHESILNLALAGQPVSFVCPYDAEALPETILDHARRTHPELYGPDGVSRSDAYLEPREYCRLLDAEVEAATEPPLFELGFDLDGLAGVRRVVERTATAAGIAPAQVDELVFAVHEVAANAVVHGAGSPLLRVWRHPTELVCEVSDAGRGPDRLAGQLPPDPSDSSGWGLWTARQMCEAIEVRAATSGNAVAVYAGGTAGL